MDPKSDEGIFMGYSTNSRAYKVFNSKTKVMMESINIVVDDSSNEVDVTYDVETSMNDVLEDVADSNANIEPTKIESINKGPSIRIQKDHPKELIIENLNEGIITRSREVVSNACFVSKFEPKNIKEALTDEFWINAMQDELGQFKRNEVWDLVLRPEGINVIGPRWLYKNKCDEQEVVTRNKVRLIAQGYTQMERVDFDETFVPVARLESIRLLLGMACLLKFKLFKMDVKSVFLNGYLNEDVHVEQPKGFIDPTFPNHVFKLKKAMYGLK